MPNLSHNVIANAIGRVWMMLMAIAFIPVYISTLGVEAYGLVGFYITLQAAFLSVFDFGLSATMSRELAKASSTGDAARIRATVRTLEVVYWTLCILSGLALVAAAPWVSSWWVNAPGLSEATVENAVRMMGLVIAFQVPFTLYRGGFNGLQRQVTENLLLILQLTVRFGGAAAVLWFFAPTIEAYFSWQLVATAATTLLAAWLLWKNIPTAAQRPRFKVSILLDIRAYALTVAANGVIGLAITQLDKLLLSSLVPIEQFAYYTIAATVAMAMWSLALPLSHALFPRFTQLWATSSLHELRTLFHKSSQMLTIIIVAGSSSVVLYASPLLLVWTGDPAIAQYSAPVLQFLVVGTALNALASIAGVLLSAAGLPRAVLKSNLVLGALLIPGLILVIPMYGITGAASLWMVINAGYLFLLVPVAHRQVIRAGMSHWFWKDTLLPASFALLGASVAQSLVPAELNNYGQLLAFATTFCMAVTSALVVSPDTRTTLLGLLRRVLSN